MSYGAEWILLAYHFWALFGFWIFTKASPRIRLASHVDSSSSEVLLLVLDIKVQAVYKPHKAGFCHSSSALDPQSIGRTFLLGFDLATDSLKVFSFPILALGLYIKIPLCPLCYRLHRCSDLCRDQYFYGRRSRAFHF